jgi:hypothetical protein
VIPLASSPPAKLARLRTAQAEVTRLDAELLKHADHDPERMAQFDQKLKTLKLSANRWTDNIFVLKKLYQAKNYSLTDKDFFKQLELPEEFDYLE